MGHRVGPVAVTRDGAVDLLRRYHEALNSHNVPALMAMYAEDAVAVSPIFHTLKGRPAIQESFENLFALVPDYRVDPNESLFIYEGDRAAEVSTASATRYDALFGVPSTEHRIEYQIVRLLTFKDTRIVYEQRLYDLAGVLERLEKVRLDDELRVAGDIQRTLLARTRHRGAYFEAVGASVPSRAIGGDFFEYADLASGAFGLAIGDVSGKGPPAALLAAMLQGMFSMEADTGHAPSVTLARMNVALVKRGIEPRFSTLFYGVLAADGVFSYASAGHLPPLLVRRDGSVERLSTGGPILGVFRDAVFPGGQVTLDAGDTVVAFSDGMTEALGATGEEFGDARLMQVAASQRGGTPAAMLDALFSAVREFSGSAATTAVDDLTVTVVRFGEGDGNR